MKNSKYIKILHNTYNYKRKKINKKLYLKINNIFYNYINFVN